MKKVHTIFYLITSTNAGGTEKALWELIRRIDRKEFSVHVCSIKKPGAFARRIADAADGFYTLGLGEAPGFRALVSFLPAFLRLFFLVRKIRPHIIHSFLFRANIMGRLAGRLAGVPVIISSIRVLESHKKYKHIIDRLTSSMVDTYLAVSEAIRNFTLETVLVPPEQIVTIYNGIDCEAKAAEKQIAVTFDKQYVHIALAGRFEQQKGHTVFIGAFKQLLPAVQNIRAYFFGEGPDEEKIRRLVAEEGLSGAVTFMGVVDDVMPYLSRMDIVALPSLWEGMPNVILEAMAAGRPVIASRIPGIDEVVSDGETGILCEPGNIQALADSLLELIQDKERARSMGMAGKRRAQETFSIEKTVCSTVAVYQELLKKGGR